jgi:hypothetical protein
MMQEPSEHALNTITHGVQGSKACSWEKEQPLLIVTPARGGGDNRL